MVSWRWTHTGVLEHIRKLLIVDWLLICSCDTHLMETIKALQPRLGQILHLFFSDLVTQKGCTYFFIQDVVLSDDC